MKTTWTVAYRAARCMRRNGVTFYPAGAQAWSLHVATLVVACRMCGVAVAILEADE
jgi:hypothetical protein